MFKTAVEKQRLCVKTANKYRGACKLVSSNGPDLCDVVRATWCDIAINSLLAGCEMVPFTETTIKTSAMHNSDGLALSLEGLLNYITIILRNHNTTYHYLPQHITTTYHHLPQHITSYNHLQHHIISPLPFFTTAYQNLPTYALVITHHLTPPTINYHSISPAIIIYHIMSPPTIISTAAEGPNL